MNKRKGLRIVFGIVAAVLLLMPYTVGQASAQAETAPSIIIDEGTIAQGVKIVSLDVSNLNAAQVQQLFQSETGQAMLNAAKLTLTLPNGTIDVALSELKASAHVDQAIAKAMKIGRTGGISQRMQEIQTAKSGTTVVNIPYTFDEAALNAALTNVANSIPRDTVAGTFVFDAKNIANPFTITDGHIGFTPDTAGLISNAKAALASGAIRGVVIPGTAAADNGAQVLMKGTKENTVKVATFTTSVAGSAGRLQNVNSGATLINGSIVKPGETFSVNDTLGPRDGSHNGLWAKAPTNLAGGHEMQYGGGLCQVSTTLFNAVFRADLEIVEWVHHSIPSAYVQIGCDATVSTGGPDFKFKNNTAWPVYIVMYYNKSTKKLTTDVYGRPLEPGIKIELVGKKTGTKPQPETIESKDLEKLPLRDGRPGTYSESYRVWYKQTTATDGKTTWTEFKRELLHKNLYPAFATVIAWVDPATKPTPTPTPSPAP